MSGLFGVAAGAGIGDCESVQQTLWIAAARCGDQAFIFGGRPRNDHVG
jgi:hypothetical protein